MDNSESEAEGEEVLNVTEVADGTSTAALIAKARQAGNMLSKNKDARKEKTPTGKDTSNKDGNKRSTPKTPTKRKSAEVLEIPKEQESFKIPKKLNSVIFPKEVRPDWLQDDEAIDELSRGEAANAISQWTMTRALMKQNDLREEKVNKTKGALKKDQDVKSVKINAGEDNATSVLHDQRFKLRTPLLKPEEYWKLMPVKWPETNKKIHLSHLGLESVLSAKTIETIHDRSDTSIEIKKFSSVNVMIGREGAQKLQSVQQVGNSIELETRDTWLDMANIWQIEEAMDNLVRVWMLMWPGDYGPSNIRGVITKHHSFSKAFEHMDTRKRVLEDFVNRALQDNAIKAGQELPPLSFKDLDDRAKDIIDRKNELRPKVYNNDVKNVKNQQPKNNRNQNSKQNDSFDKMRTQLVGHRVRGKEICAWFNVKEGCQNPRCDRNHICGKMPAGKKEPCAEKHSAENCRKN